MIDLQPRFLYLKLNAERLRLRWAFPLWAVEESLRFLMLVAPLVLHFAPSLVPKKAQGFVSTFTNSDDLWQAFDKLFAEDGRDLLTMPSGTVFVSLETADIKLELGQV